MPNMFVIDFIISAALPPTFGSAFSTVEHKNKQISTQFEALKCKEKATAMRIRCRSAYSLHG